MSNPGLQDDPITRIRRQMEIITADGRCAGHVSEWTADHIFTSTSGQAIPREWIRRVDREVYISKRSYELLR
jgi:hypothetical protein